MKVFNVFLRWSFCYLTGIYIVQKAVNILIYWAKYSSPPHHQLTLPFSTSSVMQSTTQYGWLMHSYETLKSGRYSAFGWGKLYFFKCKKVGPITIYNTKVNNNEIENVLMQKSTSCLMKITTKNLGCSM